MSVNEKSPYLQLTKQIKLECKNCKKFKQKVKSIGQKIKTFKKSYLTGYKKIFQQMMQVNIEMNKKNSKQIIQEFSALIHENKILKSLLAKVQQIKNTNIEKNHSQIYTEDKENIQSDNHTKKKTQQEKDFKSNKQKNLQQLVQISKAELQAQRLKYSELEALYKSSLEHNHRCEEQFLLLVRQTQQIKQTLTKLKTFQKPKQKFYQPSSQNSQEQLSESRQIELSSQQMSFTHSYSYELQTIKEVSEMDYQNQKQFKQHQQSYRQYSIHNHNFYQNSNKNNQLNCNQYKDQGPHTFSSAQLNNSQQNQQNLSMTRKFSINSNGFDIQKNDDLQAKRSKTSQRLLNRDQYQQNKFQQMNKNESNNETKMHKKSNKDIKNILYKKNPYSSNQEASELKSKLNLNSQSQSSSLTITEAASIMNINIHNSCFLYDDPQNQKQQKFCQALESPKNYLQALNILKSFNSSYQEQSTYKNQTFSSGNFNQQKNNFQSSCTTLAPHQTTVTLAKNKNRNKQNNCSKDFVQGSNFNRTVFNNKETTFIISEGTNQQFKIGQSIETNQEKNDNSYISMTNETNNEIKLSHEKQGRRSFGKCWKTKDIKNQIMALNYQNQCDYEFKQLSELKPSNLFNTTPKMKTSLTISYQNQIRSSTQQSKQIKEILQKAPARINPYFRNKNNSALDSQNSQTQKQILFKVEGPILQPEIKQEIKDFSNIIYYQNIFGGDMFRIKYKSGLEYEGKVIRYKNKNVTYIIPQGYGTLSDCQKKIIYTGEWKQGVFNGEGKLLITLQRVNKCLKAHNNKKTFTVKNSSYSSRTSKVTLIPKQYNGRFVNCQLQGDGTLIFSNGNKLICKMSQSSIQGQGVYFNNDGQRGTVISGRWVNNEMIQELASDLK